MFSWCGEVEDPMWAEPMFLTWSCIRIKADVKPISIFSTGRSKATLFCNISLYVRRCMISLRKYAYSNILKLSPPKNENFQIKILIFLHISAQNINCRHSLEPPRRCGSNEYPQSMFWAEIRKNNIYPCKPQFYYLKVGFKGVNII